MSFSNDAFFMGCFGCSSKPWNLYHARCTRLEISCSLPPITTWILVRTNKYNLRKQNFLTVKKSGTSNFWHSGSQWARHWVESSFCGTRATLFSSSIWKLVKSGRSALCSGRKKRFTRSSVLNPFTMAIARVKLTKKLQVFMALLSVCLQRILQNSNEVLLLSK